MINFFKDKIASFVVDKKLELLDHSRINFTKFFTSSFSFFVLMPEDEKDFHQSFEVLNFLDSHKKVMTLFTYDYKVSLLPLKFRQYAFTHGITDISKLNLPAKNLQDKLGELHIDASLDLNRTENLYSSFAANMVRARVRAGFTKPGADRYYNVQIVNKEEDTEISYKNLINCLRMF